MDQAQSKMEDTFPELNSEEPPTVNTELPPTSPSSMKHEHWTSLESDEKPVIDQTSNITVSNASKGLKSVTTVLDNEYLGDSKPMERRGAKKLSYRTMLKLSRASSFSRRVTEIRQVRNKTNFLIWPTNKYVEAWQIWLNLSLAYTFLVTPFQVAFLQETPLAIFILNRLVDASLLFDMWQQMFLAYQIDETSSRSPGLWVTNLSKIRSRYLQGWFIIDLIGLLSGVSEVVEMFVSSGKGTQAVRFARTVRLVRVLGMARSAGGSSETRARFKTIIAERTSFVMSELFRWVLELMMTAHIVACVLGYLVQLQEDGPETRSWLKAVEAAKGIEIGRNEPGSMYMVSLYWAFTTLLTIGYGDVTATTNLEFVVCTIIMVVGATAWTIFMASACAVVTAMDADRLQHGMDMEKLERMCKDQGLPVDLTRRLRNFLVRSRRMARLAEHQELMNRMSPALQSEVAVHTTERFLRQVEFLDGVEDGFIIMIAEALRIHIFPPKEWIVPGDLAANVKTVVCEQLKIVRPSGRASITGTGVAKSSSVATKGMLDPHHCPHLTILEGGIAVRRVIQCPGSCWHEDFVLSEPYLRDTQVAQSLVYCTVYTLDRRTFLAALKMDPYPLANAAIREAAQRLALTRLVIRAAELAPQHQFNFFKSIDAVKRGGSLTIKTKEQDLFGGILSHLEAMEERLLSQQAETNKRLEALSTRQATVEHRVGRLVTVLAPFECEV